MTQSRDELALLLAYFFAQDIRENPMPPHRRRQLLEAVRNLLVAVEREGETGCGKEQNN